MITVEECFHAVGWQIVFGVEPFRRMAIAANLGRNFQRRTALERDYLVLRMTIGAGGRIAMPLRDGAAMHALLNILSGLLVAATTSLGQM